MSRLDAKPIVTIDYYDGLVDGVAEIEGTTYLVSLVAVAPRYEVEIYVLVELKNPQHMLDVVTDFFFDDRNTSWEQVSTMLGTSEDQEDCAQTRTREGGLVELAVVRAGKITRRRAVRAGPALALMGRGIWEAYYDDEEELVLWLGRLDLDLSFVQGAGSVG